MDAKQNNISKIGSASIIKIIKGGKLFMTLFCIKKLTY